MNDFAVKIENLVKFYDGRCVLDGIDLKIPTGCIYGLLGRIKGRSTAKMSRQRRRVRLGTSNKNLIWRDW